MPVPPSQNKPSDGDFVLWPEAPGPGAGRAHELMSRSLAELAPPDWMAEHEAEAPAPPVPCESALREDRFYPASRQWFRTTAAIASTDPSDKWWQDGTSPSPSSAAPPPPPPPPSTPVASSKPATAELLSPEEIWELAAEELEQAGRLGAPVSPVSSLVESAESGEPAEFISSLLRVDPPQVKSAGAAIDPPPAWTPEEIPTALVPPVIPFPAAEAKELPDLFCAAPAVGPVESGVMSTWPVSSFSPPADERPLPWIDLSASSPPVAPLTAIPVMPQPPLSLRPDATTSAPLPTQRRAVLPVHRSEKPFAELGRPADIDDPIDAAAPPVSSEPVVAVGERRRRRHRVERHLASDPSPSSPRWGRWIAGTVSILMVATAAAAIVARDQLPSEWKNAASRWWRVVHQTVFPSQQGFPRRGVLPRPEQSGAGESAVDATNSGAGRPTNSSAVPPASVAPAKTPEPVAPVAPKDAIKTLPAEPVEEDDARATAAVPPAPAPAGSAVSPSLITATTEAPATRNEAFALWDGDDASGAESSTAADGTPRRTPVAAQPAPGEVVEGQKAVRSLIAARSVAEVLPWIFDAPTLESAVRDYYGQFPLQPLAEAVVEHEYSGVIPATGGKAHIFNVLDSAHPRGFPVSAESTPEGYRIDWQSYIQWRDGWLRRFLQSNSTEPQTLFVVLRRTHYFNDDVPKLDEKLAFKLTSAVPGDEGAVAFIEKNSAVGRSLADLYEWRTMYFPVVELQWVPVGANTRYLRLNRIVRPTWRRIGQ